MVSLTSVFTNKRIVSDGGTAASNHCWHCLRHFLCCSLFPAFFLHSHLIVWYCCQPTSSVKDNPHGNSGGYCGHILNGPVSGAGQDWKDERLRRDDRRRRTFFLPPDTRVGCSKLDFNYSREMTFDPLRSGRIKERREENERRNDVGEEHRKEW